MEATKEISCGAVAGCLGKIIEFPFDTVKVRLQAPARSSTGPPSTVALVRHIYTREGLLNGFYKGLKAPLLGACLETAVIFGAYEQAKNVFSMAGLSASSLLAVCTSGAVSGIAASFVLTPVELVKCNLQIANVGAGPPGAVAGHSYASVMRQIVLRNGLSGLWLGLSLTVLRELVGTAIWFATYEQTNGLLGSIRPDCKNTNNLASGAAAGFLFNLSIYPVDTIKSNIQTSHTSGRIYGNLSIRTVLASILASPGGARNLYNGLGITLLRCVPANAAIFYVYEGLKENV